MIETLSPRAVVARAMAALRPPPRRAVSEWADEKFYLSAESAAEAGKWTSMPFQRGIMDAFSDPRVTYISVMKSARVGWTKIVNIVAAKHIDEDPCSMMIVQPTIADAEGYSKEEIAPMLRDVPCLRGKVVDAKNKDSENTILSKKFPGGILSFAGANSGTGFRRIARRIAIADEIDAYPPSAGDDGDQYRLMEKRTQWYWNRKIGAGSTPLIHGTSRIEKLYLAGDRRRFFVPCPHCQHMDYLVFRRLRKDGGDDNGADGDTLDTSAGHIMSWPDNNPAAARFVCSSCGCEIEEQHKFWMIERGEWRASRPFTNHASFHIWAAYSYAPNATWGQIATEFVEASKAGADELRTVVNAVLGETWQERGDAPDWQRLYKRRESYEIGTCPMGVLFLTAGVDVQKNRLYYEVVGWGRGKRSWSIDSGVLLGDTAKEETWAQLDAVLARTYRSVAGVELSIASMAVDSGNDTNIVYNWTRLYSAPRVIAVKGMDTVSVLLGAPSAVDVTVSGKKLVRGAKMWPVGVNIAKTELYGWLRLDAPTDEEHASGAIHPPGFCHFPEYGEDWFKQITAEQLVAHRNRKGFTVMVWELIPGRQNHYLDCRVYARAAASAVQIDRFKESDWAALEAASGQDRPLPTVSTEERQAQAVKAPERAATGKPPWIPRQSGWLNRGR